MFFHRALRSRSLYGGGVLLGESLGEQYLHGYLFDHVGRFIAIDALFQADTAGVDLPGFAELKDVISGAGGQGSKEEFKGCRRGAVSTIFFRLIGAYSKGIKMGIHF